MSTSESDYEGNEDEGMDEGVEASAIEDGLTASFGDLPEYSTLSMTDHARMAADLIAKDPARAKEKKS